MKDAKTKYKINDLIKKRWSTRNFSVQPIEKEKLYSLLEAARWAPSSMNAQPWRFIIAEKSNEEKFAKVLESLNARNKIWAKNAAVLLVTLTQPNFEKNGKPNKYALHDVGLAIGNLSIQATEHEIYLHQMGGFSAEVLSANFMLPENLEPVSVIALGYKGDGSALDEMFTDAESSERSRIELEELILD
ncbi:MAG: nitroreductase family protein [Melioribacteraceae bacterium]|nr:nitroreductase family protein [Melioribacteraceae bacterium]MCF8263026.1 nitroreductase family protein [Melioribacteraceae bacterium]MCF8430471.1 nitroreductase family protein [Melioribacteraceae bacterium]